MSMEDSTVNFESTTIDALVRRNAAAYPNRASIIDGERSLTYAEFDAEIDALARALVELGLAKGDRVAVMFLNDLEFLLSYFAVLRTGAVVVPINHRLVTDEIGYQIDDAACRFFIYSSQFEEVVRPLRETCSIEQWICAAASGDTFALDDLVRSHRGRGFDVPWTVSDKDPCGIWYTSGTTGRPKGAIVTHGSSVWSGVAMATTTGLSSASRILATSPLFHRGPMETLQLAGFLVGSTHVLMNRFAPADLLGLLEQHKITHAFIVPAMTHAVLNLPSRGDFDLSSIECWLTASAPFPEEYRSRLEAETTLRPGHIYNGYGITESLLNTVLRPADAHAHRGSVGQSVPGTDLDIVDPLGASCPVGSVGEVALAANSIATGYNMEQAAWDAVIYERGGRTWYRSGDLGYRDAEGFLYLVDRTKDMVISGGENVYSAEVEQILLTHPDVEQVAVIGTPHEQWGECVTAVVVPRFSSPLTLRDLVKFGEGAIASYKQPRRLILVDDLPRNAFGKVVKGEVRRLVAEETSDFADRR